MDGIENRSIDLHLVLKAVVSIAEAVNPKKMVDSKFRIITVDLHAIIFLEGRKLGRDYVFEWIHREWL